jgi:hypothetical protein
MAHSQTEIEQLNNSLQKALKFSPNDLEANRRGRLSEKQRLTLQNQLIWLLFVIPAFVIYWGLCSNSIMSFLTLRFKSPETSRLIFVGSSAVVAVVLCIVSVQTLVDCLRGKVGTIETTLGLEIRKGPKDSTVLMVDTGERIFKVERDVFEAFHDGEHYAIYYLPLSNRIVAAEWILPQEAYNISRSSMLH